MKESPGRYVRPAVFLCDEYQTFASVGEDDPSGDEKRTAPPTRSARVDAPRGRSPARGCARAGRRLPPGRSGPLHVREMMFGAVRFGPQACLRP